MERKCADCGCELSFWNKIFTSRLCPECKRRKAGKIQAYMDKLREFSEDKYLNKNEERVLQELQKRLWLSDDDLLQAKRQLENLRRMTVKADVAKFEAKVREVGEDGYLTKEEEGELRDLKRDLGFTETNLSHTLGDLIHLKRLTAIKDGRFTELNTDLILEEGEVCHYEVSADLMEEKKMSAYAATGAGERSYEMVDNGILYVTNKRVVFAGIDRNVTCMLENVYGVKTEEDAIQIREKGENASKRVLISDRNTREEVEVLISKLLE